MGKKRPNEGSRVDQANEATVKRKCLPKHVEPASEDDDEDEHEDEQVVIEELHDDGSDDDDDDDDVEVEVDEELEGNVELVEEIISEDGDDAADEYEDAKDEEIVYEEDDEDDDGDDDDDDDDDDDEDDVVELDDIEWEKLERDPRASGQLLGAQTAESMFAWLIAPITIEEFYRDYWQKKPLVIHRQNATYYKGWFSSKMLYNAIEQGKMKYGTNIDVAAYVDGQRIILNPDAEKPVTVKEARHLFQKRQATLRVLHPQEFCHPMWKLCATLQEFFGCVVGSNIYLTPADSQGFAPHFDDVDVFVMQIEGKKHWRLYEPRKSEALPRYSSGNLEQDELPGEPSHDLVLLQGDFMYFPRGVIHQAAAVPGCDSMHATISTMQRWTWRDFLDKAMVDTLDTAFVHDIEFRKALPRRFFDYTGLMNSDLDDERREVFQEHLRTLIVRLAKYLEVDKAADAMAIEMIRDSLPPIEIEHRPPLPLNGLEGGELQEAEHDEQQGGGGGGGGAGGSKSATAKRRQKLKDKKKKAQSAATALPVLTVASQVRMIGVARLVIEDDMAVVYHNTRNTRVYQEVPRQFVSFPAEDAEVLEWVLRSDHQPFRVRDIPCESDVDRVEIARALQAAGVLVLATQPASTTSSSSSGTIEE